MTVSFPDLRKRNNPSCKTKCNKAERKELTEDDMCKIVLSVQDNLPVRCVGSWAYQKIFMLNQYFGIFAEGMKKKWNGLNYVEICSGPGRCVTRDLDEAEEFDGTALSIIRHDSFKFIKSAIFIDANEDVVSILNTRIAAMNKTNIAKAVIGNYIDNGDMKSIVSKLPPNYLNLVFIDPTDCSVPFSTIKTIKENLKNVDFIINFAVGTDLTRNIIPSIYKPNYQKVKEKYARFLGTEDFFDREDVKNYCVDPKRAKNIFLDEYKKNLLNIGFRFIESHPVEHYYYLLYVTGHPVGLKFWKEVCKIEYDGQRTLF